MQFYATAQKLRKDIMTLLLKDFGVRSKVRQLDIETRRMTTDDRNAFLAIAERYGITAAAVRARTTRPSCMASAPSPCSCNP